MFNQQATSLESQFSQFQIGPEMAQSQATYWPVETQQNYAQHLYRPLGKPAVNDEIKSPSRDTFKMKPEAKALYQQLIQQLGEETFVGDWFHVDQKRIDAFAAVTEDMQWIHTDPKRAENESPFKSTIAHGFLTLALLPKLTDAVNTEKPLFPTATTTVNLGLDSVRFPYPVRVGSNIRGKCKLLKVTPIRKGLEITREIKIEIEGVRRPGCISESVIRLYF